MRRSSAAARGQSCCSRHRGPSLAPRARPAASPRRTSPTPSEYRDADRSRGRSTIFIADMSLIEPPTRRASISFAAKSEQGNLSDLGLQRAFRLSGSRRLLRTGWLPCLFQLHRLFPSSFFFASAVSSQNGENNSRRVRFWNAQTVSNTQTS